MTSRYFGKLPPNSHELECDKHGKQIIFDYDNQGRLNTEVGCPACNRERDLRRYTKAKNKEITNG